MKRITYLGPNGSFSSMAAKLVFPDEELISSSTIFEAVQVLQHGTCDYAVLPVENSIEGTVNQTLDLLYQTEDLKSQLELILPIQQNLLLPRKDRQMKVERIYSHPQAIAQVREFLQRNYPQAEIHFTDSTASAAAYVAAHREEPIAAVAPEACAEIYQLELAFTSIQDNSDNHTRFWVLGKETPEPALKMKATDRKLSLTLTLPNNEAGILHKAMSVFAWRGIGLTKIESRPLKTVLGEYFFIIDLIVDRKMDYALEELESLGVSVKVLGEYEVYQAAQYRRK